MNAYELAKAQQAYSAPTLEEIIKQQADRIAELEKQLKIKESIYAAEPYLSDWAKRVKEQYLPQIKELSDEEIVRISETCDLNHVLGLIDFARAILKKASDK